MNPSRISIVTPSYNQDSYIEETINSILMQNYSKLEYTIIDGGSVDRSREIIQRYENRLAYWSSEPDGGQSDAIMKGFDKCSGELFAWVNSDDVLFPHCLDMVAKYYEKENKPDIVTANVAYMNADSAITRFIRVPRQSRFLFLRGVWYGTQPCVFYRAELFRELGGLDRKYHLSMDVDLWVRMMKAGVRIVHIPAYLGGFRWHHSAKTVMSLQSRKTSENHETTEILNANLPNSTPTRREFWRIVSKVNRAINLNYVRAYLDFRRLPERVPWYEYVSSDCFKEQIDCDL